MGRGQFKRSKTKTKINAKGAEFFSSDPSMTGTKQTFMIWSRVIYGRIGDFTIMDVGWPFDENYSKVPRIKRTGPVLENLKTGIAKK